MSASELSRDDASGFSPTVANALAVRQPYQVQPGGYMRPEEDQLPDDSLTLTDIWRIVLKHKWTLLLVIALAAAIAAVQTFLSTPVYRSTVILQIERITPRVVQFQNDPDRDRLGGEDAASIRTQQELLRSRSLAERVIDELRLDTSTSTGQSALTLSPALQLGGQEAEPAAEAGKRDYLDRLISGYRKMTRPSTSNKEVLGREGVIGNFLGSLTVEPVRGSRLVALHVDNTNPALAARIANTTVQSFIAMGMERRLEASSFAKRFLDDQIKQMKARLEDSERRLNTYAQANQILTLGENTSAINQTYTDYAAALAKAEQERIKAEAVLAEMKVSPEAATAVSESKNVQTYKERKATLEIEYQQNLRLYKPEFPKMQQIKAQIVEAEAQIQKEVQGVGAMLQARYDSAIRQEALLREKLAQTRKQVLTTQDHSIDLNLLKREVDTNRQLYDSLLQRFKELGVSGELVSNNIAVVDAAEPSLFPFKPNLFRNLAIGLLAGVLLGAAIVAVLEVIDDSIKYADEVERLLGLPLMGIIPKIKGKRRTLAMDVNDDPRSALAEAYRSVRTALQFSTPDGAPKRLVVTSTTRNEGKSTTSLALAINFAQMGQRVLLIDADMRNPSVHKMLGVSNEFGLSNLLSSDNRVDRLLTPTSIPNLSVLPAGPLPPNPVDLLTGPKLLLLLDLTAAIGVDYVIVDAPPMLGLADSVVLGNQLQNVLFVVQASSTRKSQIKAALRRLRQGGLVPRGAILTQALQTAMPQDYESYYGYGPSDGALVATGASSATK